MCNSNLPQWREEIKSSREEEGLPSRNWLQIATLDKSNKPRLRTVVFRGWLKPDSMLFYTDKRSHKFEQLKINNNVEVLWLFINSKSQYRFKGTTNLLKNNDEYWDKLSNESKSTWFWPDPGLEVIKQSGIVKKNINLKKPNNFIVIEIDIYSVDLLKLKIPINKRYFWQKQNNWRCIELNP